MYQISKGVNLSSKYSCQIISYQRRGKLRSPLSVCEDDARNYN